MKDESKGQGGLVFGVDQREGGEKMEKPHSIWFLGCGGGEVAFGVLVFPVFPLSVFVLPEDFVCAQTEEEEE
jgi:hypothetical protein